MLTHNIFSKHKLLIFVNQDQFTAVQLKFVKKLDLFFKF